MIPFPWATLWGTYGAEPFVLGWYILPKCDDKSQPVSSYLDEPAVVPVLPDQTGLLPTAPGLLPLVDPGHGVRRHSQAVTNKEHDVLGRALIAWGGQGLPQVLQALGLVVGSIWGGFVTFSCLHLFPNTLYREAILPIYFALFV